jgi:hypothetical protein
VTSQYLSAFYFAQECKIYTTSTYYAFVEVSKVHPSRLPSDIRNAITSDQAPLP